MKNSAGDVLQNILGDKPVEYLHGCGSIMPVLEDSLKGLKAGEKASVTISNSLDIQLDSHFYFEVVIDNVRLATDEEIKKGKPVKAEANDECGPDCNCYSF